MAVPKILIAGATGTNGRALLGQLSARGVQVRALVRDPARAAALAGPLVELVQADLADRTSLASVFEGIEKAFVVTAIHRDTVRWFANFFEAAAGAGVAHVVKFSAYGASEQSPSLIIRQHGESDRLLRESGLTHTILRPNSFFQNLLWQAESIKAGGQFFLPAGDARQSLVDVRDLAEAAAHILLDGGHDNVAYDLTGPESLSFHDVAATLSALLKREITYVPVSSEAARASMIENGLPEWDADVLTEIQALFASGAYGEVGDDIVTLLGRSARTFETFARDHLTAFGGAG
jgi:uncharacterized protein YbjT (DUF2867 family)